MRLLLVDGNNLVMRWAHAMVTPDRITGPSAQDIARVTTACERVVRDVAILVGASHCIVCMDGVLAHTEGWRRRAFPDYKADRKNNGATGLWSDLLIMALDGKGLTIVQELRDEADDVIATLANRVTTAGEPHTRTVAILSGDSDLLPCMNAATDVYQFGDHATRFIRRDAAYVCEKYGIASVEQLVLYKALVGEPGDNLPGVKGIGEKKAATILRALPTADDIRKSAMVPVDQFDLMLRLVTLVTTLDIAPIDPKRCRLV